ncbi:MAG: zf-HC2 domain-containing protein [Gemmatimonadota bacterium]|nr:zf-HC2 domain-containing protein [Gemmatimonadota bacterium]MDE3126404.1 zf-HC2 domain-containing protein [Gemmatimonadota bacterium]MDE3151075.1 zf-HC2 domain-containing protein [Gemmatimonadota bacterium]
MKLFRRHKHPHGPEMLDCEAVMQQLWDYLDEELSPDRMAAIQSHLAMCARCYPQYEFERSFLTALDRAQQEHSDPAGLRDRVAGALRAEGMVEI